MEARLVQLGAYGHEQHRMSGSECVIGREPSCDIRPDHGRVSKRHSRLFWRGGRLLVEDITSADGTFVNGDRIHAPTELGDGDELAVGPVRYLVMVGEPSELDGRPKGWAARALRAHVPGTSPSDSNVPASPAMETARMILDRLAGEDEHGAGDEGHPTPPDRHGLDIEDQHGIALARILNRDLIDEEDIRGLAQQLEQLVEAGKVRIALDFRNVQHCSSQALSTVLSVFERCRDGGGALKICTVQPAVAQLFFMTDLNKHVEIFPETVPALESVWPSPVEREQSAGRDGAGERDGTAGKADLPGVAAPPTFAGPAAGAPCVRLIVEVGKARGKAIEVKGRRFAIGRDSRCQLRPNSETVSRVHAVIERRDSRVFARDCGTKNGTILAGRTLRGEEAEAHDGDSLQVGVLRFSLQILPCVDLPDPSDDEAMASWLLDHATDADPDAPTALLIPAYSPEPPAAGAAPDPGPDSDPDAAHADPKLSTRVLACEVVNNVLVARIRESFLDDEATVGPLRFELQEFFEEPLPRRVVLSLEHVDYLSSRAVGVILAFFQHLNREHGALRVCCVGTELLPVLDSMRLPKLVDLYPSVEEAVTDPWI